MISWIKPKLPHWATALSALFFGLTFPEVNYYWFCWVLLLPWFFSLSKANSAKQAFKEGLWLSILSTLFSFYWVAYAVHNYGTLDWLTSSLLLIVFSLFNEIQFLVFPFIFWWLYQKQKSFYSLLGFFFLSFSYILIDLTLPKLFQNSLGHAFFLMENLSQIYELSGVSIPSFLIFSFSLSLFYLIQKKKTLPLVFISICLVFGFFFGKHKKEIIQELIRNPVKTLKVAAIQGNIGDHHKVQALKGAGNTREYVLNVFFRLTDLALSFQPKPDVILWPETTYPTTYLHPWTFYDTTFEARLDRFVTDRNFILMFGGYHRENRKDHNALFTLDPTTITDRGKPRAQVYQKSVLLPFGEYVPFFDDKSFFKKLFPNMGFFGKGPGASVNQILVRDQTYSFGPVICFEVLFPDYVRESTLKGSEFIVNVTNDSWFGPYGEPAQHLALSTFRGIENRIPQIRSTNTGITALILQDGSIHQQTSLGKEEILNVTIPFIEKQETLFLKYGDWFKWAALIFIIIYGGFLWSGTYRRS